MKIFTNRCYNGGNKHKFEARYSEESNALAARVSKIDLFFDTTLLKDNKYVCDICIWCGKVIKRE